MKKCKNCGKFVTWKQGKLIHVEKRPYGNVWDYNLISSNGCNKPEI